MISSNKKSIYQKKKIDVFTQEKLNLERDLKIEREKNMQIVDLQK